jgi:hypothetical protein
MHDHSHNEQVVIGHFVVAPKRLDPLFPSGIIFNGHLQHPPALRRGLALKLL